MTSNIKRIFKTSALLIAGSFVLMNCESEADNLGSQFFDGTAATGKKTSYDVLAYNINNNDTIRTDASSLTYATLGAFTEPVFGMQKSSYVTQARLTSYNPDFGTNAVVDSVVLEMKPVYPTDSVTTKTYDDYIYPEGNVAAKKVVNTYPITKYGRVKSEMTVNVHEVNDFLGVSTDMVFSNKTVNYGAFLGSKTIGGTISGVKITKDSDNSDLFVREPRIRVPLDKTFFQNKIIAKKGQPELSDVSNFIRYFKGVRISVSENDGYIMKFTPSDSQILIYYKRDVTASGTTTPTPTSYAISLGAGNARFNQIEYNRSGTAVGSIPVNPNYQTGDAKIYAQGMGGPSFGIRIPAAEVEKIRTLYKNNKIGILSAKIRLYSDTSVWNNGYEKPSTFTVNYYDPTKPLTKRMDLTQFLKDYMAFGKLNLVTGSDLKKNPAYYDILITQTFRDIIEKSADNKDIVLTVANFDVLQTGVPAGPSYTSRAYTPNRIVLVGTDAGNQNRAQLNIIYASK